MTLPKAGKGAANHSVFPVTCVVDVLWFSVTAYVQIWEPERMLAIPLAQRRLRTEQGISQASKKFTSLLPQLSTARPALTSSFVVDCLTAVITPFALPFVGLSSYDSPQCRVQCGLHRHISLLLAPSPFSLSPCRSL